MNENTALGKFIIRVFLLTLLLVGISQILINFMVTNYLSAPITRALDLDGTLDTQNVRNICVSILECFLIFVIKIIANSASSISGEYIHSILSSLFGDQIVSSIDKLTVHMDGYSTALYILRTLPLLLLIIAIWLLPYILGASIFSKVITKKVAKIEAKRVADEKEADRQKNLLLSDIAHDIKTPITTVAGFSKAISDGDIEPDQQKQYLDAIYRKSLQISDLVTLLFDYVKLDSSGFKFNFANLDFGELVRECIARQYTDFESHNMELELNIPDEPIIINGDKTQLDRAITNLLTNTIRHNPDGTAVTIDLNVTKSIATLEISDMGTAIDSDIARQIFNPFVQGDSSRTSGKGSGLGLSITKKIVVMHRGSVKLIQYLTPEKYNRVKTFQIKMPLR